MDIDMKFFAKSRKSGTQFRFWQLAGLTNNI